MRNRIHNFESFTDLYEAENYTNLIIGDSVTPIILKNSKTLGILGSIGSERTLWKSGIGVKWLKNAVAKYPVNSNVKNLVINIGTNGAFNPNDDIKGLISEIKRAFPLARLFAVQGSWGWGYNKNVTISKVNVYYDKFRNEGVFVIEPAIGKVRDPHTNLPIYRQIGDSIDQAILDKSSDSFLGDDKISDSIISPVNIGTSPEKIDPEISEKYNFHLIPDGKGTNYRSAQFPLEIMKQMYPKYSIKNVIRLNGDGNDGRHLKSDKSVSTEEERKMCRDIGCNFYDLSPISDQDQVNEILSKGNTLIHCAHGADRTGGNVASYLYTKKQNPKLTTTEDLWKYTTQYNDWNSLTIKKPNTFTEDVYLEQAKKFGVRDLEHAQELAKKYKQ